MTRKYTNKGKLVRYYVEEFMKQYKITEDQAYEMYCQTMRDRGSKGGKLSPNRPFRDVPNLAREAVNSRFKK